MRRDTKFNYGFFFGSLGLPFIADFFLGRKWAVIVAITVTVGGFLLLLSGHQHREKDDAAPARSRLKTALIFSLISLVLGFGVIGIRAVIARPDEPVVDDEIAAAPVYMLRWGPTGTGNPLVVVANGEAIKNRGAKYRVAAVAYHWSGEGSPNDVQDLLKSDLHEIQEITISIPASDKFRQEVYEKGFRGTNYSLLLVPKQITMDQFWSSAKQRD